MEHVPYIISVDREWVKAAVDNWLEAYKARLRGNVYQLDDFRKKLVRS